MTDTCSVQDIFTDTLVLAFDVAGWTQPKDAERIANSKEVVAEIRKAHEAMSQQLAKKFSANKPVTQDDAVKVLTSVADPIMKQRLNAILSCAFKDSPLGIWLDKNEWVLYVFLPVIAVGTVAGGVGMYIAEVGDMPASLASAAATMAKKSWDVTKLGKITLGAGEVNFEPSKGLLKGQVVAMLKMERLELNLKVGAGVNNKQFDSAGVQFGAKTTLPFKGSGASSSLVLSLDGTLKFDNQGVSSVGGGVGASYNTKIGTASLTAGVNAAVNDILRPNPKGPAVPAVEVMAMLTISY